VKVSQGLCPGCVGKVGKTLLAYRAEEYGNLPLIYGEEMRDSDGAFVNH
jgi:hypothetical protein